MEYICLEMDLKKEREVALFMCCVRQVAGPRSSQADRIGPHQGTGALWTADGSRGEAENHQKIVTCLLTSFEQQLYFSGKSRVILRYSCGFRKDAILALR